MAYNILTKSDTNILTKEMEPTFIFLYNSMIACRENQGFQLLLPGAFFDVMQSKKIQKGDKKAYL